MSWNPVLNRFLEIKEAFVRQFGRETLFAYDAEKETCLEYWVRRLEKEEDRKTFMLWVEDNVPAERKALLREMYLGRPYNVLRTGSGHLRKMRELKGGDRREIFEE